MVLWQSLAPTAFLAYLASAVALAHLATSLPPKNLRYSREAASAWGKSTGRDDSEWKNKSKGLDPSNLMSSVEAEKGPAHAQVLRWKKKQEAEHPACKQAGTGSQ